MMLQQIAFPSGCIANRRTTWRPSRCGWRARRTRRSLLVASCSRRESITRFNASVHDGIVTEESYRSRSENFVESLENGSSVVDLNKRLDSLYELTLGDEARKLGVISEGTAATASAISDIAKGSPLLYKELLHTVEIRDPGKWTQFQADAAELKMRLNEIIIGETESETFDKLNEISRTIAGTRKQSPHLPGCRRAVLITGFESFNISLYKNVGEALAKNGIILDVFSDRDINTQRIDVKNAIAEADIFFGSLLFDFDQVEWLKQEIQSVPVRVVFESAVELMSETMIGSFQMKSESRGPPPIVKAILSKFGSGREEDKLTGYLSFLKIGPSLLKFIPGNKARDLRNWLQTYAYWNQGGEQNVEAALQLLAQEYFETEKTIILPEVERTPDWGVFHPDADKLFESAKEYVMWYRQRPDFEEGKPVVAVLLYKKHVITKQYYLSQMIRSFEMNGVMPVPIFINGVEAHTIVRDRLTSELEIRQGKNPINAIEVDAIVNTIGFPLVGGPAGTMEGARQAEIARSILKSKDIPYFAAAPLLIQDMQSWIRGGIQGLQSVVLYSLPELDGSIDTVPLGGLVGDNIFLVEERLIRLCKRINAWHTLKKKKSRDKKVAIILYGFPPNVGATGTAALLNVPKSLENLLHHLRNEGYDIPSRVNGEQIVKHLETILDPQYVSLGPDSVRASVSQDIEDNDNVSVLSEEVSPYQLRRWLQFPDTWGPSEWGPMEYLPSHNYLHKRMVECWGGPGTNTGIGMTAKGSSVVSGLVLGNVFIGVQPMLGVEGDPMRLLFERDLTPHPQYCAFYLYLQKQFCADALIHFGMHGTVEWLPGSPLGNTGLSWSDVLIGNLPNAYIYAANNPSESVLAKRRGYGTLVSHNVPPYSRSGVYNDLKELKDLLNDLRDNGNAHEDLRGPITEALIRTGMNEDKPPKNYDESKHDTRQCISEMSEEEFLSYGEDLYGYLIEIENRLFSEGLHTFGNVPSSNQLVQYLEAYFGDSLHNDIIRKVAFSISSYATNEVHATQSLDETRSFLEHCYKANDPKTDISEKYNLLDEAIKICRLLQRNTEELEGVSRVLSGRFLEPELGGDLLRDGPEVLPTGKNIFSLDPYRIPSPAAIHRGLYAARAIIEQHRRVNNGAFPETVSVALWGLDAIKTKGESIAIILGLVGAEVIKEGTGRVVRFALIPLDELAEREGIKHRPRIDVLGNMSGIFRDSFQNVVELLDDMFSAAATADESTELNYIKKHTLEMKDNGITGSTARLFSNPSGDFGSMVNERVGSGEWEEREELGGTWASRNSFSYGRGKEKGKARPEVLRSLLKTTDRIVQEIDSVEYGLTDIQEYYANTGALKAAAETARDGRSTSVSIVETVNNEDPSVRELEDTLRMEYRSKLLNPKWAKAMAAQGSGGAYEISQRMTAMVGWAGTAGFAEDWTYNQAVEQYVLDDEMASKLKKNNKQAFANIIKRSIEAHGRGFWNADERVIEKLKSMFLEVEAEIEGVSD